MFISEQSLANISWQAFERNICRLLIIDGYEGVRLVGQSNDHGGDIIASKNGRRWLFQVKRWKIKLGVSVLDETVKALTIYRAHIPVVVALNGFDTTAREHQVTLLSRGIPMQLWDKPEILKRAARVMTKQSFAKEPREYQIQAISAVFQVWQENFLCKSMIVMATGLGKTYTAAASIERINAVKAIKVLVLAHTNEIVYQLEKAFWPFLTPKQETLIWNGYERPEDDDLERAQLTFGCLNSVSTYVEQGGQLPQYDFILVDECHHVGGEMYKRIISTTSAGTPVGPFLLGLTATPWRPDETDLKQYFGEPIFTMDMVTGMRFGYLSNVDYRMYVDNINWEALSEFGDQPLSPRQINRTLFIVEWDNAVVRALQSAWGEITKPRAIIFCGTIDHAITMRDQINSLGFCNAEALYSQTNGGRRLQGWERNRILADFHDGFINALCVVDILNEGVDIPDVNLIVFQRVTHSRRIFIQQLGRGLRLSPDKEKVVVLDFVSDVRRFAAGINLKNQLSSAPSVGEHKKPIRISLKHKVSFVRSGNDDPQSESFLKEWLRDVATIEDADEDASILKFPPSLVGGRN
jgi:superfamily II DNA or RNA helicase